MSKQTATYTATTCLAVTPNDSTDLSLGTCRAIYVGGAGNISLIDGAGSTILFSNVAEGSVLPVQTARIRATDTTATLLVALY